MFNKRRNLWLCSLFHVFVLSAQTWVWYPGDYEIWLGNQMNNQRTERGAFYPPVWKTYDHYSTVEFSKTFELKHSEEISITTEGRYQVKLNNAVQPKMPVRLHLPAGKHTLNVKVWNILSPPALYINGETIKTDSTWQATCGDRASIKDINRHKKTWGIVFEDVGFWNFNSQQYPPSKFALQREPQQAVSSKPIEKGTLYDFGKETFGYITFNNFAGKGLARIYYGETPQEAVDTLHSELYDHIYFDDEQIRDVITNNSSARPDKETYTLSNSKAFRYVYIVPEDGFKCEQLSMEYEYLPVDYRGSFRCNDEELNQIWDVAAYTMHLTTREFFIDGIKRDRWAWSGDAIQSYLMNYYLFFNQDAVKRTIWLLRGKDPVTCHLNTILDYTFFWFLSIHDYYMYTGDLHFVHQIYPRMQSLMQYVLERTNANGMVEGLNGDWVFVDWSDDKMDKRGELSFEQVLFCRSLETMSWYAELTGHEKDQIYYTKLASDLRAKLLPAFWDEEKKALVNNRVNGMRSNTVTRYANMFATFFNYFSEEQKNEVKASVLLNDSVSQITTPYMRFYEMDALCSIGEQEQVLKDIKAYWGGMLREGATTFWEKYNPEETGNQHYTMYNRPYGKSLCHAWGASPIYLLGKYYLGVKPTKEGYKEFAIEPVLGGLKWMEGTVPTPHGSIHIYMDKKQLKVKATEGKGYIYIHTLRKPKASIEGVEKIDNGQYRLWIDTKEEVIIKF